MPTLDPNRKQLDCEHVIVNNWDTGERQCEKCGLVFDSEETFD